MFVGGSDCISSSVAQKLPKLFKDSKLHVIKIFDGSSGIEIN